MQLQLPAPSAASQSESQNCSKKRERNGALGVLISNFSKVIQIILSPVISILDSQVWQHFVNILWLLWEDGLREEREGSAAFISEQRCGCTPLILY